VNISPEEYDRAFENLLMDSIILAQFAHDPTHNIDMLSTFARHSTIASLLLLETAANTCLESLDVEATVHEEIDKLPVGSKFDLFLRIRFRNQKLNRGLQVVATLHDLKLLRDAFVHPKRHRLVWESWSEEESVAVSEKTRILGISKYPSYWSPEDAVTVMKSVHDFLNYYFGTLCRLKPRQVSALLFSSSKRPDLQDIKIPYWDNSIKEALKSWRIDLDYMKLGWMKYGE